MPLVSQSQTRSPHFCLSAVPVMEKGLAEPIIILVLGNKNALACLYFLKPITVITHTKALFRPNQALWRIATGLCREGDGGLLGVCFFVFLSSHSLSVSLDHRHKPKQTPWYHYFAADADVEVGTRNKPSMDTTVRAS